MSSIMEGQGEVPPIEKVEAGDLPPREVFLATEEVNRRNVIAIRDYTKETRLLVRSLEERIEFAERRAGTAMGLVQQLQQQLGHLQARVLAGGKTSGDDLD